MSKTAKSPTATQKPVHQQGTGQAQSDYCNLGRARGLEKMVEAGEVCTGCCSARCARLGEAGWLAAL